MAKIDHHIHTSKHSPDSEIDPDVLIDRAVLAGLDVVVITEHDYQWKPDELADLNAKANAKGLTVLSGVEVSAREGHFLVYGLPDLSVAGVFPGISLKDLMMVVRDRNAAVVAAHPFRWDQDFGKIVSDHGPVFDGVELVSNNVSLDTRAKAESLLKKHPMGATGSSDGHVPEAVGCYYTEFPGEIRTMSDFVAALQSKQGRPRHRTGAWQAAGPTD
jgi:predicted metal-dependent phosphoesterase TrpH